MSVQLKKWTVEEYERLVALGALTEHDRVQLVEGEIVEMIPQKAPHMTAVRLGWHWSRQRKLSFATP